MEKRGDKETLNFCLFRDIIKRNKTQKQMEKGKFVPMNTLSGIFFRFFGGVWAGASGAIIMGIVLFLTWSIVGDTLDVAEGTKNEFGIYTDGIKTHPLFMSIVLLAVFLSSLVSNLIFSLINSILVERYPLRSTTLTHVFLGNLIILVFMVPIYLLIGSFYGPQGIAFSAMSHTLLAGIFTFFAVEILSTSPYIFISLYGSVLGIILFLFTGSFFSSLNPTILSFLVLPLLLGFLNAGNAIVEMFYFWFSKTYGIKFLETDKRFGSDYGRNEIVVDEEIDDL